MEVSAHLARDVYKVRVARGNMENEMNNENDNGVLDLNFTFRDTLGCR